MNIANLIVEVVQLIIDLYKKVKEKYPDLTQEEAEKVVRGLIAKHGQDNRWVEQALDVADDVYDGV